MRSNFMSIGQHFLLRKRKKKVQWDRAIQPGTKVGILKSADEFGVKQAAEPTGVHYTNTPTVCKK